MSRFEIEDIVSQDKRGIVFRAHDAEKGHTVALRRFFPFGQDGGGLSEEESVAFRIAAKRLDGVRQDSLRSVITGAVDPIDGMPYIVAEWIDGAPLDSILDGGKLDAPNVIEVLRLALEVSLALSEVLGEEAVWVETEADSIFVGSQESCRGFVFWLSPFKWLGAEFSSRKLAAVVELGERLAGWKGKLVGDNAGNGLGGWLKWMRNNPDAALAQALEALSVYTKDGGTPPPPQAAIATTIALHPVVKVKPPSPVSPLIIAACVALLLAVGGLAYYHRTAKAPAIPPEYAEQQISPPIVEPSVRAPALQASAAEAPKAAPEAELPQDAEAIAAARVNEMAAKLAQEKEAQRAAAKAPVAAKAPPAAAAAPRVFAPDDVRQLSEVEYGSTVKVRGILLATAFSKSGKTLYFHFSDPVSMEQVRGVAYPGSYAGKLTKEQFAGLIGKTVVIEGKMTKESWYKWPMVLVTSQDQVKLEK